MLDAARRATTSSRSPGPGTRTRASGSARDARTPSATCKRTRRSSLDLEAKVRERARAQARRRPRARQGREGRGGRAHRRRDGIRRAPGHRRSSAAPPTCTSRPTPIRSSASTAISRSQDDLGRDHARVHATHRACGCLGEERYNAPHGRDGEGPRLPVPKAWAASASTCSCAQGEVRAVMRSHPGQESRRSRSSTCPRCSSSLAMERRGLMLVTGITGSGKSTTLAAMIDYINRSRNDHIVTIEDPIEFTHDDRSCVISQREIGHDSHDFATGAARRPPPGPRRHPGRRDARRRDHGGRAPRGGDRPPRALHAPHAERHGDGQPHHRRPSRRTRRTRSAASSRRSSQGIVSQRLVVRADGKGRVPAVEVLVGTGLIRDCIREAKQDPADPGGDRRRPRPSTACRPSTSRCCSSTARS